MAATKLSLIPDKERAEFLHHPGGRFPLQLPPDPLLPEGHDFTQSEVLITEWGGILPSVDFSRQQFEELIRTATTPQIPQSEEVILFAQYLASREGFVFDEKTGCWKLPLKAFYDEKRRAKYPHITIGALGIKSQKAHRTSLAILRGITVGDMSVDHLCRAHSCCNPYHLEAVDKGTNTLRGARARKAEIVPSLFQQSSGTIACSQLIARNVAELA